MKTYELKCTQCGANLVISTDKDHAFCEYCGHRLVLAAENEYEAAVQVQASKDAAKVKMHEIDKATELEQTKAHTNKWKEYNKSQLITAGVLIICLIMLFFCH